MKKYLTTGAVFMSKHFKGHVEVLEMKESDNVLQVKVIRSHEHYHQEDWNLEHTLVGFQRGDYFFSESLVQKINAYTGTIGCMGTGRECMLEMIEYPDLSSNNYFLTKPQLVSLIERLNNVLTQIDEHGKK